MEAPTTPGASSLAELSQDTSVDYGSPERPKPEGLVASIGSKPVWMLVDSGACTTVLEKDAFSETPLQEDTEQLGLRGIGGQWLTKYGKRVPTVELPSGRTAKLEGTVADAVRSAMSVGKGNDNGLTFVFSPSGGYMTKTMPTKPRDAEDFVRQGSLYYLPLSNTEVGDEHAEGMIAPVEGVQGAPQDGEGGPQDDDALLAVQEKAADMTETCKST